VDETDESTTSSDGYVCSAVGGPANGAPFETIPLCGHGVDLASEAIVHAEQSTATGSVKRLTEIVRLEGDLTGYVLYQPTQVFDFVDNTLVVTGTNVFSGTIVGSDPVVLQSVASRFDVDLATGEETGTVRLTGSDATGARYRCDLVVVGTGQTADGDPTFDYRGVCARR
jgi:hypothetical protein